MKTTMNVRRNLTSLLLRGVIACSLLSAFGGCSKGPAKPDNIPDLTPVTVTVTYNGQPVAEASVLLSPISGQFAAAGTTDSAGKAVMKTDGMYDGVAPGEYRATITKREKLDVDLGETPEDPAQLAAYEEKLASMPVPKHLIPEKYSSFSTSGLTVTVAGGAPLEETFELSD